MLLVARLLIAGAPVNTLYTWPVSRAVATFSRISITGVMKACTPRQHDRVSGRRQNVRGHAYFFIVSCDPDGIRDNPGGLLLGDGPHLVKWNCQL